MVSRREVELLPCRAAMPFEVETAGLDGGGQFRISGIMNSFGVTHSGRLLHPRGFENWLKRSPGVTLPMLANHGDGPGFATIGVWDGFTRTSQGMRWSGYVAEGVPLADQARTLLEQRVLRQLSVGWITRPGRWVKSSDTDLDPHVQQVLEESGADEALVYLDWYPVEGSIVDVGDDPAARLAAGAGGAAAAVAESLAAVNKLIEGFIEGLDQRLADLIETRLQSLADAYGLDYCAGDGGQGETGESADGGESDDGGELGDGEESDDGAESAAGEPMSLQEGYRRDFCPDHCGRAGTNAGHEHSADALSRASRRLRETLARLEATGTAAADGGAGAA